MTVLRTAALLLFVAAPAAAQTDTAPAAKPVKEKKVCRRMDTTGSIMSGSMVCHTKADWAAIDDENARQTGAARDTRGAAGGMTPH